MTAWGSEQWLLSCSSCVSKKLASQENKPLYYARRKIQSTEYWAIVFSPKDTKTSARLQNSLLTYANANSLSTCLCESFDCLSISWFLCPNAAESSSRTLQPKCFYFPIFSCAACATHSFQADSLVVLSTVGFYNTTVKSRAFNRPHEEPGK